MLPLDFNKAFSEIDHDILIKMEEMAIDPVFIEWTVKQFLTGRKQVKIKYTSNFKLVNGGEEGVVQSVENNQSIFIIQRSFVNRPQHSNIVFKVRTGKHKFKILQKKGPSTK